MEENKNDIHIGEKERIRWVDFNTSSTDLIDIDYIVAKHDGFWTALQIFCVPGCCGLEAFRFYPEDIKNAVTRADKELLRSDLSLLKADLINSDKEIVISSRLNNLVDKTVFMHLLEHIADNI